LSRADVLAALADHLRTLYPTASITLHTPEEHPLRVHGLTLVEQGISVNAMLYPFPAAAPVTVRLKLSTAYQTKGGWTWVWKWANITKAVDGLLVQALAHIAAAKRRQTRRAALAEDMEMLRTKAGPRTQIIARVSATGEPTYTVVRHVETGHALERAWAALPGRIRIRANLTGTLTLRQLSREDVIEVLEALPRPSSRH
jgi:hypothetical protein